MGAENIVKKEGKILFKKSFFSSVRGDLVLTTAELYHVNNKAEKSVSIPVKDILNTRTAKDAGSSHYLYVTYRGEGQEKQARFMHFSIFDSALAMGSLARVQANYFTAWQEAIENLRSGRKPGASGSLSELEHLAALRDKGILTEEEFRTKKKILLGL